MCKEDEGKIINIANAEDLLTLTRVIAELQSENAGLKVENASREEWSERYRKWWKEELEKAEKADEENKRLKSALADIEVAWREKKAMDIITIIESAKGVQS